MSDGERKKKIAAGRQMFAQRSCKKKRVKNNSSLNITPQTQDDPNAVQDSIAQNNVESEKNCGDHWKNSFSTVSKEIGETMEPVSPAECKDAIESAISFDTYSEEVSGTEDHAGHSVLECSHMIKQYQEALQARDRYITLLTSRLESTFKTQDSIQEEGVSQTEILTKELYELHRQVQEVKGTLEMQKRKNVSSFELPQSLSGYPNFEEENILHEKGNLENVIESKEKASVIHDEMYLSNQSKCMAAGDAARDHQLNTVEHISDVNMIMQVEQSEVNQNICFDPGNLDECLNVDELLESHISNLQLSDSKHLPVQNWNINKHLETSLVAVEKNQKDGCLKQHKVAAVSPEVNLSNKAEYSKIASGYEKSPKKVLKRLGYLNVIAEMIESLLNLINNIGNKTFDASNVQIMNLTNTFDLDDSTASNYLESQYNDSQLVISSTGSSEYDYNKGMAASEIEAISHSSLCHNTSVEVLRKLNISDKLTDLREFFREEINTCYAGIEAPDKERVMVLKESPIPNDFLQDTQNVQMIPLPTIQTLSNNCLQRDAQDVNTNIILLKKNLERCMERFRFLEDSLKETNVKNITDFSNGVIPDSKGALILEEIPLSNTCLETHPAADVVDNNQTIASVNENSKHISANKSEIHLTTHTENDNVPGTSDKKVCSEVASLHKDEDVEVLVLNEHETFELSSSAEMHICSKCKMYIPQLLKKFNNELLTTRQYMESKWSNENIKLVQTNAHLEKEVSKLKNDKNILEGNLEEKETMCSKYMSDFAQISDECRVLMDMKSNLEKQCVQQESEMLLKIKELQDCLMITNRKAAEYLESKADIEYTLQNQIADLVQEHQQDMNSLKKDSLASMIEENKKIENKFFVAYEEMKNEYEAKEAEMQDKLRKDYDESKQKLVDQHAKYVAEMEAKHSKEMGILMGKENTLLEEKHVMHTKHKEEMNTALKMHGNALSSLCLFFELQIAEVQKKVLLGTSISGSQSSCFVDIFNNLGQRLMDKINTHLNQNVSSDVQSNNVDEILTLNQTSQQRSPYLEAANFEKQIDELKNEVHKFKIAHEEEMQTLKLKHAAELEKTKECLSENLSLPNEVQSLMMEEANKLKEDFETEMEKHKVVNDMMADEIKLLRSQISLLGESQSSVKHLPCTVDKAQDTSDLIGAGITEASVGHAAQTNSRLLHVLSDLVKTFLDIEHDINSHLVAYGVIGQSMDAVIQHDDDTGQNVGSREDFMAFSVSESPNLELCEDGLDLTPRAWDLFASMGAAYDADAEGEDVVIGASRRLRSAVDHVLHLLSRMLENQQSQDLKNLVKHNEELSHDLQEESRHTNVLQIELVTAKNLIKKLETEKRELEDLNLDLKNAKQCLSEELASVEEQLKIYEGKKETVYENKECLVTQQETMEAENDKMPSCTENSLPEQPEVFESNTNSTVSTSIHKNLSKERHSLVTRVHNLELSLDEVAAQKDDLIEKKQREIDDLKAQMESMDKQLQSNRKFIEEQTQEREQEREEFLWQLSELKDIVKEKEKIQECEDQLTKEVSNLEQLLKMKMEDNISVISKKEELENELRQSFDKIRDLRDVIRELEEQLELKSCSETELKKQLGEMLQSLSVHEKDNNLKEESEDKFYAPVSRESTEHLQELEEQLASRTQELEQMAQSHTLLQELRGQIHFLEAKVETRIRQLESMYQSSLSTSPIPSDDTSHSESQEGDLLHTTVEDGWAMSPRSLHWLEIRRLEEKIGRLAHIEEELVKRNKDLESHLRKIKITEEEHHHEKAALQEQVTKQLLQISALKSRIEEQRHKTSAPLNAELKDLRECLIKEQELKKAAESNLLDLKEQLKNIQDEIKKKDAMINKYYDIQTERRSAASSQKIAASTQTEKSEDSQILGETIQYCLPSCFELLLKDKNEQIDNLTVQLQALQDDLDEARKGNPNSLLMVSAAISDPKVDMAAKVEEISELHKKKADLTNRLHQLEVKILTLEDDIVVYKSRVNELEDLLQDSNEHLEIEQSRVKTLLEEKCLEDDFNTVQDMMLRKEKELATLQEETEIQMRLEAEMDTLHQILSDQKSLEKELKQKVNELQKNLEDSNRTHMADAKQWHLNLEEVTQKFTSEEERLKQQIHILRQNVCLTNDDDIDVKRVWQTIIDAADVLSPHLEVKDTFHQLVFHVLQVFGTSKVQLEQKKYELDFQNMQKSWQKKVKDHQKKHQETLNEVMMYKNLCQQHETEKAEMEHNYQKQLEDTKCIINKQMKEMKEQMETEKDEYWQEKLKKLESILKSDFENEKKLLLSETRDNVIKSMEDMKKSFLESHQREVIELKQKLDAATKEKDTSSAHEKELNDLVLTLKSNEMEKNELVQVLKSKLLHVEEELKMQLNNEKKQLEESYHSQMKELQAILSAKLMEKEQMQARHREEMDTLHNLFKDRWNEQLMKLHQLHQGELKKAMECKDESVKEIGNHLLATYQEKLKEIQNECEQQIALERKQNILSHQMELQQMHQLLEEKFYNQKQKIVETGEEQLRMLKEELEERYDRELSQVRESHDLHPLYAKIRSVEDECKKTWENEKQVLESQHQKEINSLKNNFQRSLDNQQESLLQAHQEEMKQMEQVYIQELKTGRDVLQGLLETKGLSFRDTSHDSSPTRTNTPSSEVSTSSDNTSSSLRNAIPPHLQIMMDKMNKEGLEVLSLSQMTALERVLLPLLEEVNQWKKEKLWIIHILKSVADVDEKTDLKVVVSELAQELKLSRESLGKFHSKERKSWEHMIRLQNQLSALRELLLQVQRDHISHDFYEVSLLSEKSPKSELLEKLKQDAKVTSKLDAAVAVTESSLVELRNLLDLSVSHVETSDVDTERKAQICLNCNATENSSMAERQRWIHEKSSLQRAIEEAQNEISEYRCQLQKLIQHRSGSTQNFHDSKVHYLFCKYKRSESLRKALVYQKKYLLFLLSGYQATEKVTLAVLNRMNGFVNKRFDLQSSSNSSLTDQPVRGKSLFRSIGYVIIAVNRMKFIQKNRQILAKVPPFHIILQRIESLMKKSPATVPDLMLCSRNASICVSSSTLSHSPSVEEFLCGIPSRRRSSASVRDDMGSVSILRNESLPGRGQLIEYVNRLEALHEQLGLHSLNKS